MTVHLFNRATSYMDQGLYDRAIDTYLEALEIDPRDAKTHYALGSAYLAKGLYDRAEPAYQRALALNPDLEVPIRNDLGVYFILTNQLDRAEEKLLSALEADPEYELSRLNLARVYSETGRRDLALEQYRRILEIPGAHPEQKSLAVAEIAISRAEAGALQEAKALLERALKFNPGNEVARLYLGDVLGRMGDREGARRQWRALAEDARDESVRTEAAARLSGTPGGGR